ncbi:MAG: DUF202 domain-containing protein [Acidobacteriota bacterium]
MKGDLKPKTAPVPPDKRGPEYLANERTFLAWIRTSVSMISLGFVVDRFGLFLRQMGEGVGAGRRFPPGSASFVIGDVMMAFGGVLAILAAWRYHVVNQGIEQGKATADRGLVILVTLLVALLAGAMIVVARP